jgi:GntR family transcriptional regulator
VLLNLDKHGGVAVYRQIVDQLRHQIVSGQLPPGTQLVSVRDLAAQLAVNPMTVSKAYTILEERGLVERRNGIGVFVAAGNDARKTERLGLLESAMRRAAIEALHLQVNEQDALALLSKVYRRSKNEGGKP